MKMILQYNCRWRACIHSSFVYYTTYYKQQILVLSMAVLTWAAEHLLDQFVKVDPRRPTTTWHWLCCRSCAHLPFGSSSPHLSSSLASHDILHLRLHLVSQHCAVTGKLHAYTPLGAGEPAVCLLITADGPAQHGHTGRDALDHRVPPAVGQEHADGLVRSTSP